MTFTATFPIGYSPGSPRELYIEDEPLVVEFEADVRIERGPVEVGWPPVVKRGVSIDCDVGSVEIESAMLKGRCERCEGKGTMYLLGFIEAAVECYVCNGIGKCQSDILPTLSAPDLARLKEDCAEWTREHAVKQQANS